LDRFRELRRRKNNEHAQFTSTRVAESMWFARWDIQRYPRSNRGRLVAICGDPFAGEEDEHLLDRMGMARDNAIRRQPLLTDIESSADRAADQVSQRQTTWGAVVWGCVVLEPGAHG